ncbi:MAG: S-adenosylmethionine decarboxylase [Selenomonadaceae bacterium]|nr:S-adenosylmethionine decarboxylase [Selenomonadaceae bacterium]MBR1857893.1 S-adenosylmethionine decarboxylase [Selenomonadaceae bacterium]
MKILARQLTIDFYNCNSEKLDDIDKIKAVIEEIVGSKADLQATVISNGHISIIGAFEDGHIAIHVYSELGYVAVDVFTCSEDSEPELLSKELRKFFQPDKIKSTFLKRGDFGLEREIKPKIKTRLAPLRKIHNTGAKVIKTLARRNSK